LLEFKASDFVPWVEQSESDSKPRAVPELERPICGIAPRHNSAKTRSQMNARLREIVIGILCQIKRRQT
jgi:hypothetical protein